MKYIKQNISVKKICNDLIRSLAVSFNGVKAMKYMKQSIFVKKVCTPIFE